MSTRRRFPIALGVAAAALAAAGSVAVVLQTGETKEPPATGPVLAPVAAVLDGAGDSAAGPPVAPEGPNARRYDRVSGVAARGRTFVAVGERLNRGGDPRFEAAAPLIWWSDDAGAAWHAAAVAGSGALSAVVADGDRFVAVGTRPTTQGGQALVLTSADGRAWNEAPVANGETLLLHAAVATPAGPVLAGSRVDIEGIAPMVILPDGKGGWKHDVVLLGDVDGYEGEVRGACAEGKDLVLVGKVVDRSGKGRAFVLRSPDGGAMWRSLPTTAAMLTDTNARANACALSKGRLAIVGTATIHAFDRGFISVEKDGSFPRADALESKRVDLGTETLAHAVAAVGSDFVAVGYDTADDLDGDLAAWRSGAGEPVRLARLEALGGGRGVAEGRAVLVDHGVVVVAGTSADRAVVWRSSPAEAEKDTAGPVTSTTIDPFWSRYGRVDACALLTAREVADLTRGVPVTPRLSATHDTPRVVCNWSSAAGNVGLSIELTPPSKVADFAHHYPAELAPRTPVPEACTDAWYYPGIFTVAGVCKDAGVALGGVPSDVAGRYLRAIAARLKPAR